MEEQVLLQRMVQVYLISNLSAENQMKGEFNVGNRNDTSSNGYKGIHTWIFHIYK